MLLRRQVTQERDEHIDMTPMVDVVFQLMTFMLFSVQMESSAVVDVPHARHGVGVEDTSATFLTLLPGATERDRPRLLLGNGEGREVDREAAAAAVSQGVAEGRRNVVIQADGSVPEGEVIRLIGDLSKRESGVSIRVGVQEPE